MTEHDDPRLPVRLVVNDDEVEVRPRGHHTLLDVLRRELDLFGARPGCTAGACGSCTVLVDGAPASSCLLPAHVVGGRPVRTVEGLAGPGELHPVQQAFIDHTAFQCSYCTPGFILTAVALLDREPDASRERIRAELAGNLCRCGSYVKIMDAVLDARDRMRGYHDDGTPYAGVSTAGASAVGASAGRSGDSREPRAALA
ncbi:isoquinoline 1-oxidoreductase, alpha subunit [Frankia sp. EI5c]|uniref:(2Fe-2S)-binding protein n=1 Tax=Frankia sp. EI5c TaxID=683316 RepID=UPI0007C2848A|nr:(2Fe-2S)-binding protein [Frankia sp. EI5c]OAA29543.1 isoquinoline 1-oxidoreductase, alpha subunit [Frankia sp. EI5c]